MGADQGLTRLFFDAGCGLCQGAVRFVARHDRSGNIRFAPLGGVTFECVISPAAQAGLPDSLLVLTPGGELLTRSRAVRHLLGRMGPMWRFISHLLAWMPPGVCDFAYDRVARRRSRTGACLEPFPGVAERLDP